MLAAACVDDVGTAEQPSEIDPLPTEQAEPDHVEPYVISQIRVDQFGYRPTDTKVAVIADPIEGFDSAIEFTPGDLLQVRRWADDSVAFEAGPSAWSDGATHTQSGDRGWWFDFSELEEPGSYYIIDPSNNTATGRFEIGDDVYDEVLDAALRALWFNRLGTPHPAELAGPWADEAAYLGPGQDSEARWIDDRDDPDATRDLSGGWADAGDTNKYVTFAAEPVHQLLTALARHPEVFGDSVGIPESGNGLPDVLDEVLWEIEWIERMQEDDGGVLTKVGVTTYDTPPGPPSESTLPRFYEEECSSSTIVAAAMFAHTALVLASTPSLDATAERLLDRAVAAWDWYQDAPQREDCDSQEIKAGDADLSAARQDGAEVVAAVYLYDLTGNDRYHTVVREGLWGTMPFNDDGFGRYAPHESDALLHYRSMTGADASTVDAIDERIDVLVGGSSTYGFDPSASLYRSFMPDDQYHWGSNRVKANIGSANLAISDIPGGTERAQAHLHYFHGLNPLDTVYLSNMDEFGADHSVGQLFHYWFGAQSEFNMDDGSEIGAAPGYVVGGPNWWYSGQEAPPASQPPMKSYLDSNGLGSEPLWEVSEPAIYYQAAYIHLLVSVMASP